MSTQIAGLDQMLAGLTRAAKNIERNQRIGVLLAIKFGGQ